MNKSTRNAPCIFNTFARSGVQIGMKGKFKKDLADGFTLAPSVEDIPRLMRDHSLVTARYRGGHRDSSHLMEIIGMSLDVDHHNKGRSTTDDEVVEVIQALGSPECFWAISSRGGIHFVFWLPSCLEGKTQTLIDNALDTVRFILKASYRLPEGWYIDENAKGASRSLFPGGHEGHYCKGKPIDEWYESVRLKEGERNSSVFRASVQAAKSGDEKSVEIALRAGTKSGLEPQEVTAIARSAASYAVKDDSYSVANAVVEALHSKVFYSTLDECYYRCQEVGIWKRCSSEIFKKDVIDTVAQLGAHVSLNSLTRSLPAYVKSCLAIDNYKWPSQVGEIPLENGVLYYNSNNGLWQIREYRQSDRFIDKYSVSITPKELNSFASPSAGVADLLNGFTSNKQVQGNFLALVHRCLLGDNHDQRFALVYGPSMTGKSLSTKILKAVMGGYFYILQSTSVGNNRFGLDRRLEGPRVVSIPELSNERMPRDKIVNLASTDHISLESKGKDSVEVHPTGIPIATTNTVPRFSSDDSGVMARLLFINFDKVHPKRGTDKEEKALIEAIKHDFCVCALAYKGGYVDGDDKKKFAEENNEVMDAILYYFPLCEGNRLPLVKVYDYLRKHGVITSKQGVTKAIEAGAIPGVHIEAKRGRPREVIGLQIPDGGDF